MASAGDGIMICAHISNVFGVWVPGVATLIHYEQVDLNVMNEQSIWIGDQLCASDDIQM